ncbi:hypothetical protein [Spirosoma koreense]
MFLIAYFGLISFIAYQIDNTPKEPYRRQSFSSKEAEENNVFLGRYKLVTKQQILAFKEAWTEQQITYFNNKKDTIDRHRQSFVILIALTNKAYLQDHAFSLGEWSITSGKGELEGKFRHYKAGGIIYFDEDKFGDTITLHFESVENYRTIYNHFLFKRIPE